MNKGLQEFNKFWKAITRYSDHNTIKDLLAFQKTLLDMLKEHTYKV